VNIANYTTPGTTGLPGDNLDPTVIYKDGLDRANRVLHDLNGASVLNDLNGIPARINAITDNQVPTGKKQSKLTEKYDAKLAEITKKVNDENARGAARAAVLNY
jgi:hypothetical protein